MDSVIVILTGSQMQAARNTSLLHDLANATERIGQLKDIVAGK